MENQELRIGAQMRCPQMTQMGGGAASAPRAGDATVARGAEAGGVIKTQK